MKTIIVFGSFNRLLNTTHLRNSSLTLGTDSRLHSLCMLCLWKNCFAEIVTFNWLPNTYLRNSSSKLRTNYWLHITGMLRLLKLSFYVKSFSSMPNATYLWNSSLKLGTNSWPHITGMFCLLKLKFYLKASIICQISSYSKVRWNLEHILDYIFMGGLYLLKSFSLYVSFNQMENIFLRNNFWNTFLTRCYWFGSSLKFLSSLFVSFNQMANFFLFNAPLNFKTHFKLHIENMLRLLIISFS